MAQHDQPDFDVRKRGPAGSNLTEEDKEKIRIFGSAIPMIHKKKGIATIGLDFSKMEKKEGQKYCPKCDIYKDVKYIESNTPENVPDRYVCRDCGTFLEFIPMKKK